MQDPYYIEQLKVHKQLWYPSKVSSTEDMGQKMSSVSEENPRTPPHPKPSVLRQ